jgi:serine/threonine protein kinase
MVRHEGSTADLSKPEWPRRREARASLQRFPEGSVFGGKYRVRRLIGRGGMGSVLEVECLASNRLRALKYCEEQGLRRRRLIREAAILASISHHHVMPVHDLAVDHDPPYYVMALAVGSLEDDLPSYRGRPRLALRVFREVCVGVEALHNASVVHRDLKPSNILRLSDGRHVVADLGTAKREPRASTILTQTSVVLGTLGYLAPEQLEPDGTRDADARTDVYQLGKLLYRMVTGKPAALLDPAVVPGGLRHLIERACAQRPEDRYADLEELISALDRCLQIEDSSLVFGDGPTLLSVMRELEQMRRETGHDLGPSGCLGALLNDLARLPPSEVVEGMDRFGTKELEIMAAQNPGILARVLRSYARGLETSASRQPFSYADRMARRMRAVLRRAVHPELIAAALEALLVTAVCLNRFSALAVLRELLYGVVDGQLALEVADMLRRRREFFQELALSLRPTRLHPAVREVLDELAWIETVSF